MSEILQVKNNHQLWIPGFSMSLFLQDASSILLSNNEVKTATVSMGKKCCDTITNELVVINAFEKTDLSNNSN